MRLARHSGCRGEGLGIWIIVLAIMAGAVWFLYSSRKDADQEARKFAQQVAEKLAVEYDEHYLQVHLNPENQASHLPSWRDRLLKSLKSFGPLAKPVETTGTVLFTSQFFEPRGTFRSELTYPTMTAHFDFSISKGMNGWRIDELNLVWNPPPTPTPTPSPPPVMSPRPTPTPEAKTKRRKQG